MQRIDQPNYNPLNDLNSPLHPLHPSSINPASPYYQSRYSEISYNSFSDGCGHNLVIPLSIIILFIFISVYGVVSSSIKDSKNMKLKKIHEEQENDLK